jgi:recombinational DNA repair protein RecT
MEIYMSAAMDRLREDVAAQKTVTSSVLTLLNDISNKLKDAITNEDTTAIEAISADLEANTKSLSDAVLANTPAQGTEPPA